MPNITLAIDEKLLEKSREYAKRQQLSLNALIRQLLEERVDGNQSAQLEACFAVSDKLKISSQGKTWTRDDLYER